MTYQNVFYNFENPNDL
jgi:hypothetical protein